MQLLAKQRGVKGAAAQLDQRLYNAKLMQDGEMQRSAVQFSVYWKRAIGMVTGLGGCSEQTWWGIGRL